MNNTGHIQLFRAALALDWRLEYKRDEWFFSRLMDDIVKPLSSHEAFAAIDEIVELLTQQTDLINECGVMYECGSLLSALVSRSQTTELPRGLRDNWDTVQRLLPNDSGAAEWLRRWYRKP